MMKRWQAWMRCCGSYLWILALLWPLALKMCYSSLECLIHPHSLRVCKLIKLATQCTTLTQWMQQRDRHTHTHFEMSSQTSFQPEISYALTTSYPELFVNFAGWSFCFIQNYLFHFVHSFFPRIIFTFCVKLQCVRYRFWQKQMSGVGAHGMEAEQTLTFLHIHVYVYAWDMTDSAFSNVIFVHGRMKRRFRKRLYNFQ